MRVVVQQFDESCCQWKNDSTISVENQNQFARVILANLKLMLDLIKLTKVELTLICKLT